MASAPTINEESDAAGTMKALQAQFKLSREVMSAFKASELDTLQNSVLPSLIEKSRCLRQIH